MHPSQQDSFGQARIELEMAKWGKWQPREARAMLSLANQLTNTDSCTFTYGKKKVTNFPD